MTRRRRGAALILVVVVIAALLAIAAPFVVSMRLHEQSARAFHADVRARQLAETARNQAIGHLMRTHPDEERRAREARGDRTSDDEGHDDTDELTPDAAPVAGLRPLVTSSANGEMALVEVADARGRIDLNACGPDAIANLLGVTVTTAVLSYEEEDALLVEDTTPFFSDGDPETRDGFVRVNGEEIFYSHTGELPPARTGEPPRPALLGLGRRGFFSGGPPPEEPDQRKAYHAAGSLVQDGRGWKVAFDPIWRHMGTEREGQLARFDGAAAIRRIADWEWGQLKAALVLQHYGVNLARLRAWGIPQRTVLDAGLDPALLGDDDAETPEEKEKRQEAERKLGLWGISTETLKRFGGARAVLRAYEQLAALEAEPRRAMIERYKDRLDGLDTRATKVDGWLKDEIKRQLADLSEMRENAPHIETIGRIELEERIRPFMTTDAPPIGEQWTEPQVVQNRLEFTPTRDTTAVRVQDSRRFMPDMIARVQARDRSRPPEFRYVRRVRGEETVQLLPQLDWEYEQFGAEISVRLPSPINVNTAPREVLVAVLVGLVSRIAQTARAGQAIDMVTPTEARAIADAIIEDRPPDFNALRATLLELASAKAITAHDVDAVFRNGVDPMDPLLLRSSVPFCFRSGDVYELTSTGIVNGPSGLEVGRRRFREAVRVAPPRDLRWTIDSQWDFSDRIYIPGVFGHAQLHPQSKDAHYLHLLHAWSNLLQTREQYLGPYGAADRATLLPSTSHAPGAGDIQPLLSHEPEYRDVYPIAVPTYPGAGGASGGPATGKLYQEDLDGELDGRAPQGLSIESGRVATRHFQWEVGTAVQHAVGPGSFRAWVRIDSVPGRNERAYVFDGGQANGVNRMSLYFEGARDLVLSMDDEAMDQRESGLPSGRPTELRYTLPVPLRAGEWYHVGAAWKGADPTDLHLSLDGRSGGKITPGTRLTAAVDAWDMTLAVEDASSFPDQGLLRLDGYRFTALPTRDDRGIDGTARDANDDAFEVLAYTKRSNTTLQVTSVVTFAARPQVRALDHPNPATQPPLSVRQPVRGTGRRYDVTVPGATDNPQRLRLGFEHPAGTLVVPYGYHSQVKNEHPINGGFKDVVRRGGGALAQPLPRTTPASVLYEQVPGYTVQALLALLQAGQFDRVIDFLMPQVINGTETTIRLLWAGGPQDPPSPPGTPQPRPPLPPLVSTVLSSAIPGGSGTLEDQPNQLGGWPETGIIRITSFKPELRAGQGQRSVERVLYRGINRNTGELLNCVRNIEGDSASGNPPGTGWPHFLWDTVVLESVVLQGTPAAPDRLDPTADYPDRPRLDAPRVYVSLTQQPGTAAELTEWLSVQKVRDDEGHGLKRQGLLLLPALDSLLPYDPRDRTNANAAGPGILPRFPLLGDLVLQMLVRGGDLGPNPGLLPMGDPQSPHVGQLYKELFKRWEISRARAKKGTSRPPGTTPHPVGVKVVPTFAVRDADDEESNRGDVVTIADEGSGTPRREEKRVAHAAESSLQTDAVSRSMGNVGDACNGWLVAFDDFVGREYQGAQHARLARWPVGNVHVVPDLTLGQARPSRGDDDVVDGAPGVLRGMIDDVSSHQIETGGIPNVLAFDAQTTTALIEGDADSLRNGALFRIDEEVVAVVEAQAASSPAGFAQCTLLRGALGTTPQAHGDTRAWRLYWPAHAVASGGFAGARGKAIPTRGKTGVFRPFDGYVAIDRGGGAQKHPRWAEQPFFAAFPYAARGGNDHLVRAVDVLDRGAFDRAFGSEAADLKNGDLLIDLPFRHHDRYAPGVWSYEGLFFSAGRELGGAYVTKVDWDETLPGPFCEVKVAVRLDGAPGWDAQPADRPGVAGGLYVFDDPEEANEVLVRADRVELRVYLTFKPGAFYEGAWKRGAIVGAVRVHYRQATQSLRREERSD